MADNKAILKDMADDIKIILDLLMGSCSPPTKPPGDSITINTQGLLTAILALHHFRLTALSLAESEAADDPED